MCCVPAHAPGCATAEDCVERIRREAFEHVHAPNHASDHDERLNGSGRFFTARVHRERNREFLYLSKLPTLEDLDNIKLTDVGNAQLLIEKWGPGLRYVKEWGWQVWDGTRWSDDNLDVVRVMAKDTLSHLRTVADQAGNEDAAAHALASENRVTQMVKEASDEPGIRLGHHEFDGDPDLLNTPTGIVNLQEGVVHEHAPEYHNRRITAAGYDPDAPREQWLKFLDQFTQGDKDLQDFLQRAVGYSLTGRQDEQSIFFLYGPTAGNGKSTFIEGISYPLGDYFEPAASHVFLEKRDPGGPSPEIIALVGARMIGASEFSSDQKLSTSTIKQWTGEGTITARGLHKDPIKFQPVGKPWIMSNHFPNTGGDEGVNRRINVVPARAKFTDDPDELARGGIPRDKAMLQKLRQEATGILAWAIEGAQKWYKEGLQAPETVRDAVESYKSETDPIYDFWASCIDFDDKLGTTVAKKPVYHAYRAYCQENGNRPLSQNKLTRALKQKGALDGRSPDRKRRVYVGMTLNHVGEEFREQWELQDTDLRAVDGSAGPQRRLTRN